MLFTEWSKSPNNDFRSSTCGERRHRDVAFAMIAVTIVGGGEKEPKETTSIRVMWAGEEIG
jgi:hypothetical protein